VSTCLRARLLRAGAQGAWPRRRGELVERPCRKCVRRRPPDPAGDSPLQCEQRVRSSSSRRHVVVNGSAVGPASQEHIGLKWAREINRFVEAETPVTVRLRDRHRLGARRVIEPRCRAARFCTMGLRPRHGARHAVGEAATARPLAPRSNSPVGGRHADARTSVHRGAARKPPWSRLGVDGTMARVGRHCSHRESAFRMAASEVRGRGLARWSAIGQASARPLARCSRAGIRRQAEKYRGAFRLSLHLRTHERSVAHACGCSSAPLICEARNSTR